MPMWLKVENMQEHPHFCRLAKQGPRSQELIRLWDDSNRNHEKGKIVGDLLCISGEKDFVSFRS
jgi:hypothetical protein